MRNIKVTRTVSAPRTSVWAVLSDYPNIVDWNEAVFDSFIIGDATEGVGAQRLVELGAKGAIKNRETVTEWVPEERLIVAIDEIEKQPIKHANMTFTLADSGDNTTFTMTYNYEPKFGFLAHVYGPVVDRLFSKGFNSFIDDLEPTAQRHESRRPQRPDHHMTTRSENDSSNPAKEENV